MSNNSLNPIPLYDIKGYPIQPGDLVRTYHFTGRRGKIHYLYHVASLPENNSNGLKLIPAAWADPNYEKDGGDCFVDQFFLNSYSATILAGIGPASGQGFCDRVKRKKI